MHGQLPVSGYVTTEKISSDKMPFNTRTQSDLNLFWHVIDQHIGLSVKEREKKIIDWCKKKKLKKKAS